MSSNIHHHKIMSQSILVLNNLHVVWTTKYHKNTLILIWTASLLNSSSKITVIKSLSQNNPNFWSILWTSKRNDSLLKHFLQRTRISNSQTHYNDKIPFPSSAAAMFGSFRYKTADIKDIFDISFTRGYRHTLC